MGNRFSQSTTYTRKTNLSRRSGAPLPRSGLVHCTDDDSIFALGDCAEVEGRVLPFVLPVMHAGRALANILNGEETRVNFPAMPVVVKTPAHPVAVLPVARDAAGAWQVMASGQGVKMGFFDKQNKMTGFILTGEYAGERSQMTKMLATQ